MTSRERVLKALDHKEPDRLPIDLGGSIVTGINAMAYQRLQRYLGLKGQPPRINNIILLLAEVEPEVICRFGVDVVPLNRYEAAPGIPLDGSWKPHPLPDATLALFPSAFSPIIREDGTWELHDGKRVTDRLFPGSGAFVPCHHPLAEASVEELELLELPRISDVELEFLNCNAKRLQEDTEYAVFGWFNGCIFELAQFLCGWDSFYLRLGADLEFARRLLRKLTDRVIADLKLYLQAVGEYIQVIGFGDDFGLQNGLQFSPELFRELFKPLLAEIYATAHSLTGAKLLLHSCGSVYELIEDFIEIGVEILNPVQTSARHMEPERLKRDFGDRLCFWGGGADAQHLLPRGSPEEVHRDVRRRIEILGEGGGFVFAPIHNILADVPPENIEAMYEEASRRG